MAALALLALALAGPAVVRAGAAPGAAVPAAVPAAGSEEVGRWTVTSLGEDHFRIAWRSPTRLPTTSDRPTIQVDGLPLGAPTVADDGRTVLVEVRADVAPTVDDLDVVLSGDRLDEPGTDLAPAPEQAGAAPAAAPLGVDPGAPGPHAVVSSDYELDPVPVQGMEQPIEMVGHVVEPAADAATGPRPLVLFLHGRHSYCYNPTGGDEDWRWPCRPPMAEIPSHLGYDYIQRLLASQGFATVSVRVNGINAQDDALYDGGAAARSLVVQRHLDHWVGLAAAHQVDLDRVVLVGHSRGGEGVAKASLQIPLGAPYTIAGQVLLAPTDFGTQTSGYVPTVTVLPYCDGDVIDLQGQKFTDVARDLAADDTSLKSSVLVLGANHNYFNTEWTPGVAVAPSWDDWWGDPTSECGTDTDDRLSDAEQRAVGAAYVAGAVRLFARGEQEFLPLYDGSPVSVASAGDAVVRSHALGGGRVLRRPGSATGLALADGADTHVCLGVLRNDGPYSYCGRGEEWDIQVPHWSRYGELVPTRRELEMSWTAAGQSGGLVFDRPLDLTGRRLELRTIVDPDAGDARLSVRLTDTAGGTALLTPEGGGLLPALPLGDGLAKRWAQALVVDPSPAGGLDVSAVSRVELVSGTDSGRVWVLDVAAAPDTLAPVPQRRLALVDLGTLRIDEGDGGRQLARVPFTVTGDLPARAGITVAVADYSGLSRPQRLLVDLAPGQTSGTIPVQYDADRRDDRPRQRVYLTAWARRGVMVDGYVGGLVIRDDDPSPRVTVSRVDPVVREGGSVRVRVSLGEPVDYPVLVRSRFVRGPGTGPRLTVADVPRSWLRSVWYRLPPPRTPLFRSGIHFYQDLERGRTSMLAVAVPTRRDGVREGRESVTVSLRVLGRQVTRSFVVTD